MRDSTISASDVLQNFTYIYTIYPSIHLYIYTSIHLSINTSIHYTLYIVHRSEEGEKFAKTDFQKKNLLHILKKSTKQKRKTKQNFKTYVNYTIRALSIDLLIYLSVYLCMYERR